MELCIDGIPDHHLLQCTELVLSLLCIALLAVCVVPSLLVAILALDTHPVAIAALPRPPCYPPPYPASHALRSQAVRLKRKKSEEFHPTEHLWILGSGLALAVSVLPHTIDYFDIGSGWHQYSSETMSVSSQRNFLYVSARVRALGIEGMDLCIAVTT